MGPQQFLARLPPSTIRLGLERIQGACRALGDPQGAFQAIHVAGTNGKGSTSAFLASALAAAGKRVGLYTSPHLLSFRERIRIGGEPISEEDLGRSLERLLRAWPAAGEPESPDSLTYFEAATALAFDAFAHGGVDVGVIEVGLGGRLDATNVEGKDLAAAVVTRVAEDHVDLLGRSLEGIAREKGGIARRGAPLVVGMQRPPARAALLDLGASVGARVIDVEGCTELRRSGEGLEFLGPRWSLDGIRLGLRGWFQEENARVALATLETLGIDEEAARVGLAAARWPGRLDVVREDPTVVVDGAHNPEGAKALARALEGIWPGRRPRLVFGVLGDKERGEMMRALFPLASAVHLCPPPSDRAVDPRVLAEEAGGAGEVHVHGSVGEALDDAIRREGAGGLVVACGSLFLVGAALSCLGPRSSGG